jgi:hypothetical protein
MSVRGRPFQKGQGGRKPGSVNKATKEVQELAQNLVTDEDYLASLVIRLKRGTAGAMEPLLWQYAFGKPKDSSGGEGSGGVLSDTLKVIFGGRYKPGSPPPEA